MALDDTYEEVSEELDQMLYASHAEVNSFNDLQAQRGTPIPALFNQFYKFIQNPSTVSVETYKRMVDTDDTIGSGVDFLTTCLAARMGMYTHPSKEITKWVNDSLNNIDGGFMGAIKEMLSATWAGFSVSEIVWENSLEGFKPKKLVSLPPGTIFFETNRTGELTEDGILQYQRNYNPAILGAGSSFMFGFVGLTSGNNSLGASRPDAYSKLGDLPFPMRSANSYSYLSIRIPKSKCLHYSHDAQGRFGNPYGRSLLRRAYKYYIMKDAFLQMLATALDRKGTPLTVIFADPNATTIDQDKFQQGQNLRQNRNVGIRADVAALNAFKDVHNDSVIVLPGKKGQIYDIEVVPQDSNADVFIASIDMCNKSIMRSLLIPSLIFTGGDGSGAYALGQEHAKTFEKILDGTIAGFKQVLLDGLIKQMIAYNFPRESWEKDGLGDFSKRTLSADEIQKEMDIVEKAVNIGAVNMNDLKDLNVVRDKAGFEPVEKVPERPDMFGGDENGNEDELPREGGEGHEGNSGEESGGSETAGE